MIPDTMDERTYNSLRKIIYDQAGIALGEGKHALVHARIGKRLRALNLNDYDEYLQFLQNGNAQDEIVQLLDVISTNTTSFFRESVHFELLTEIIHAHTKAGKRQLRIWCAAASTGEEPYTLSMVVQEALAGVPMDLKILATDISTKVLAKCRTAEYSLDKLTVVTSHLRDKYFHWDPDSRLFTAKDILRSPLTFARLNLMENPYPMRGPFDVVFCRNVMIYFDKEGRLKFVNEALRLLAPDGYLFTGHAESLTGLSAGIKSIKPSVYQKVH